MTNNEVLSSLKTKRDVIRKFGKPTEKDIYEGVEIWYYNLGSVKTTKKQTYGNEDTDVNLNRRNTDINIDTDYSEKSSKRTSSYTKYVEFQFDGDKTVSNWRSNKVDYGRPTKLQRRKNITRWVLIGELIDLAILIAALAE